MRLGLGCRGDGLPGLEEQEQWEDDPESIEEHEVHPEIEPVGGLQVRAAHQPLRAERHPSCRERRVVITLVRRCG